MVDTIKRNKRQNIWQKENADRINFIMPKGMKEQIKNAADACGLSSSEYIREAIIDKLRKDGFSRSVDREISEIERVPLEDIP